MRERKNWLWIFLYDSVFVSFVYVAFCSFIWLLLSTSSFLVKLEEPIIIDNRPMNMSLALAISGLILIVSVFLLRVNQKWRNGKICFDTNRPVKEISKVKRMLIDILQSAISALFTIIGISSFFMLVFSTSSFFAKVENPIIISGMPVNGALAIIISLFMCIMSLFGIEIVQNRKKVQYCVV